MNGISLIKALHGGKNVFGTLITSTSPKWIDAVAGLNLDFIFIPLPEKYALYHRIVNNDNDDDFLIKVYAGLDKRQIQYINLCILFNATVDFRHF